MKNQKDRIYCLKIAMVHFLKAEEEVATLKAILLGVSSSPTTPGLVSRILEDLKFIEPLIVGWLDQEQKHPQDADVELCGNTGEGGTYVGKIRPCTRKPHHNDEDHQNDLGFRWRTK